MARKWFCGLETGDFSECGGSSSGVSTADTVTFRSGAYAAKFASGGAKYRESKTGLNLSTLYYRLYVNISGSPATKFSVCGCDNSSDLVIAYLKLTTSKTLEAINGSAGFDVSLGTGTAVLATNSWTMIELKVVISAGSGIIEVRVNGVVDQTYTGLTTNGRGNVDRVDFGPANGNPGIDEYFDDLCVDDAAYPGAGAVVARQWLSSTPTYNGWTKSTGSTIDTCWNDTPFNATTNANSGLISVESAQTAIVSSFSSTQTGHGADIIGSSDTINGIKVGVIANASTVALGGGAGAVRLRIGAADFDTNVTLTTSDVYYESAIRTDTVANLNSAEGGFDRQTSVGASTHTVEDAWMIVDFTPNVPAFFGVLFDDSKIIKPTTEIVGY